MALVFINYRTVDAAYGADAVAAQLAAYIGKDQVFLDHDSMDPGDDYPSMIRAALAGCKILIAIIGPNWLSAADSAGVRLIHRQRDWVRREIAEALAGGIRVVPLLIRGAALPDRKDLPWAIQRLTRMQARDLSFRELGKGVRELVEDLARTTPELLAPRLFEPDRTLGDRHLPSALLRAEYGIVPFQHRTDELTALRGWVQDQAPVSSKLLTAEGGQGKTRLALRLCHELRRSGWTAGILAHDLPADVLSRIGELDVPLLVVIDYAEGRTDQVIAAVQSVCARERRAPARVLLLSRCAGEWQEAFADAEDDAAAAVLARTGELALPPLVPGDDRAAEFARALAAFASRYNATTTGVAVPGDLDDPRYRNALDIHAAALAGLLDQLEPDGRGPEWSDPVLRVLRHEHVYWERTTEAYELVDPHRRRLDQVVAAGTLFGCAGSGTPLDMLTALPTFAGQPPDVVERFLRWRQDLYPGDGVLGGMRPDRLGEDHAANTLVDKPELATALVPVAGDDQVAHALTVLGRAAPRHPLLNPVVAGLLRDEPIRLLPIGMRVAPALDDPTVLTAAMSTVAGESADLDLLDELVHLAPDDSLALAEFSVVVTRRALELYTLGDHDPEDAAMLMSVLGNRLIDVDDFDAALPMLAEAARLRQQFAAHGDAQQRADLADTLSSLASALAGVGQYEAAVERAYESVGLLRELGDVDPERFVPDFVAASINLAKPLLDTARSAETLALLAEAVRLSSDLVEADTGYLPSLASALEQQGYALDKLGRVEEGFVALEKSAGIYRVLAEEFPDEFADSFTTLLGNLAGILRDLNRNDEGLALAQEALDTAERLVAIYGDRFEPLLANVHNNRGIVLGHSRLHAHAEDEIRKALRIYRKLADRRPEVYLPDVALTLGNHALHLRELGQVWDAVAEDTESADIYRKLAGPRPELLPDLVDALIRLYLDYDELSEPCRAHEAIAEAVSITRRLMASDPETSRSSHATALQHLAANLVELDRTTEAVTAAHESLSAGRALARQQPDLFDGLAAETAYVLGLALAASQRYRKARHAYAEALGRYRRLAERDADTHRVHVAAVCTDLAVTQQVLGDRRGGMRRALRSNRIAEATLRELIKAGHELDGSLGSTLDNLAAVLAKLGRKPEAVGAVTEAVVRCRTAYRRQPELFQVGFWSALRHNAHLFGPAAIKESVALLAEAYDVAMAVNDDAVRHDMLAEIRDDLSEYPAPAARRAWSELSDRAYPIA